MQAPKKTVGVYERPAKSRWPLVVALAVVLLAVLAVAGVAFSSEPYFDARFCSANSQLSRSPITAER